MSVNDRISELINALELNPNSFADQLGVKNPVIYNIVKGRRSKPSFELLQKILVTFHAVNANWLVNGQGDLWKRYEEIPEEFEKVKSVELSDQLNVHIRNLQQELGKDHLVVAQLGEMVSKVIQENVEQKNRIIALYQKQDKIMTILRDKLSLDI